MLARITHLHDDDFASMNAHAQLQCDAPPRQEFSSIACGGLLHRQRRKHSPFGIVFMGHRGAEKSQQAITTKLIDLPAKPVDFIL